MTNKMKSIVASTCFATVFLFSGLFFQKETRKTFAENMDNRSTIAVKGDLDGDGEVTVNDLIMMRNIVVELLAPTDVQLYAGDVSGKDGKIDSLDLVAMRLYLAGRIDKFDGEEESGGILLDETLRDYIIALYDFENGVLAHDAFSGTDMEWMNLPNESEVTIQYGDFEFGSALISNYGGQYFGLPDFSASQVGDRGLTIAFIAKSADNFDEYSVWNTIVDSGSFQLASGCSSVNDVQFSPEDAVIGRGAYTENQLSNALASGYTLGQLSSFNDYVASNAFSFANGSNSVENEMATQLRNGWHHFAIVIHEEGIKFFRDGALAYWYNTPEVCAAAEDFVGELQNNSNNNATLFKNSFGYVDNLVFGYAMDDAYILALYNDMMSDNKSFEDVVWSKCEHLSLRLDREELPETCGENYKYYYICNDCNAQVEKSIRSEHLTSETISVYRDENRYVDLLFCDTCKSVYGIDYNGNHQDIFESELVTVEGYENAQRLHIRDTQISLLFMWNLSKVNTCVSDMIGEAVCMNGEEEIQRYNLCMFNGVSFHQAETTELKLLKEDLFEDGRVERQVQEGISYCNDCGEVTESYTKTTNYTFVTVNGENLYEVSSEKFEHADGFWSEYSYDYDIETYICTVTYTDSDGTEFISRTFQFYAPENCDHFSYDRDYEVEFATEERNCEAGVTRLVEKCSNCGFVFATYNNINYHQAVQFDFVQAAEKCGDTEIVDITCRICDSTWRTENRVHVDTEWNIYPDETNRKINYSICRSCNALTEWCWYGDCNLENGESENYQTKEICSITDTDIRIVAEYDSVKRNDTCYYDNIGIITITDGETVLFEGDYIRYVTFKSHYKKHQETLEELERTNFSDGQIEKIVERGQNICDDCGEAVETYTKTTNYTFVAVNGENLYEISSEKFEYADGFWYEYSYDYDIETYICTVTFRNSYGTEFVSRTFQFYSPDSAL